MYGEHMKVTPRYYWNQYRFLAVLTILSSIVCWWGWFVSKSTDGMPFARSGAVATAILLAFLVSNYAERLEQVQRDAAAAIEGSGNWTQASAEIRKEANDKVKALVGCTRAAIRYWYACLMFLATMIWGLGDYFFLLVHRATPLTTGEIALRLFYLGSQSVAVK